MRKLRTGALAAGAISLLAVAGLSGQALAASSSATEWFTISLPATGNSGPVLAYQAFNDQGTDVEGAQQGRTGTSTFKLQQGNIVARHTDNRDQKFSFDRVHCVAHLSGTGAFTITSGTGAYAGISGHGTYTVTGTLISAHTANGCSRNPIGGLTFVHAHGPVSLKS